MHTILGDLKHAMLQDDNRRCAECRWEHSPQWASVTYGVFLCSRCAAEHRKLGLETSFVRSLSQDAWTRGQVERMLAGGNRRIKGFLHKNQLSEGQTLEEKYHSTLMKDYRRMLDEETKGKRRSSSSSSIESKLVFEEKCEPSEGVNQSEKKKTEVHIRLNSKENLLTIHEELKERENGESRSADEPTPVAKLPKSAFLTGNLIGTDHDAVGPALCLVYSSDCDSNSRRAFATMKRRLELGKHYFFLVNVDDPENKSVMSRVSRISNSTNYPQLFIFEDGHFWYVGECDEVEALHGVGKLKILTRPCQKPERNSLPRRHSFRYLGRSHTDPSDEVAARLRVQSRSRSCRHLKCDEGVNDPRLARPSFLAPLEPQQKAPYLDPPSPSHGERGNSEKKEEGGVDEGNWHPSCFRRSTENVDGIPRRATEPFAMDDDDEDDDDADTGDGGDEKKRLPLSPLSRPVPKLRVDSTDNRFLSSHGIGKRTMRTKAACMDFGYLSPPSGADCDSHRSSHAAPWCAEDGTVAVVSPRSTKAVQSPMGS